MNKRTLKREPISTLEGEYWVPIPSFQGYYEISNLARVRSVDRVVVKSDGSKVRKTSQLRKVHINADGYLQLILVKDSIICHTSLHIQVACAFIPNPDNLPEVNHKDGDKTNCLPYNLEWGTHLDNMRHAVKNKLRTYEGKTYKKLSKETILIIFNSLERTGLLAKKYGVTKSSIQRIKNGKTYSNITNYGVNQ